MHYGGEIGKVMVLKYSIYRPYLLAPKYNGLKLQYNIKVLIKSWVISFTFNFALGVVNTFWVESKTQD